MKYDQEYIPPTLSVDAVVFQLIDNKLCVLLIQRAYDPFKDMWALPGGYNPRGETTKEALGRILTTKTSVSLDDLGVLEQLYTFDTIARDPRGHAVSVTYMGLCRDIVPTESENTQTPGFFPINDLPELAYDHADIITYAHKRLSAKVTYTNTIFALLPRFFTLTQLQTAYEAIFCRQLDKRNFRKKFLSLDLIEETDELYRDGAHRPAKLYKFKQQKLQTLSRSFD